MKKLWLILVVLLLTVGAVILVPHKVKAATEGVFTYTVSNGEATIKDCASSASGALVVPSTLGGYPVTNIGGNAFERCYGITSITLPESVNWITNYAFYYCTNLRSINIPDGVEYIGEYAFYGCSSLESIDIPAKVTELGEKVLDYCGSLKQINVDENNAVYSSVDGVMFNKSGSTLLKYPCAKTAKEYSIPNGVEKIADNAFHSCSTLTSVTFSDTVKSIGIQAFFNCSGLKEIDIPETVTSIDGYAFEGCSSLVDVTIPKGITVINDYVFEKCAALKSISIPEGVTKIGVRALSNCDSLSGIELPSSLISIEKEAFYYCPALTSITIPNKVTSIARGAFNLCFGLTTVYFEGTETEWNNIVIGEDNEFLLNAEIVFLPIPEISLEDAVIGTSLKLEKMANGTEVLIIPADKDGVAMTENELCMLLDSFYVTIASNNGKIVTGSKLTVGNRTVALIVSGDVDGDGIATTFDAMMIKKALKNNAQSGDKFSENDIRKVAGDINGTNVTDNNDISEILAFIVGKTA